MNVPLSSVSEVISSQFEFAANSISSVDITDPSTFKQINLPYLGKFILQPKRAYTVTEHIKRKRSRTDEEHS